MDVEPAPSTESLPLRDEADRLPTIPWRFIGLMFQRTAFAVSVLSLGEGAFLGSQLCHGDSLTPHYSLFQILEAALIMVPWLTLATFAGSVFGAAGIWPYLTVVAVVGAMCLPRFPRFTVARVFGSFVVATAGGFITGYLFLPAYNGSM